MCVYGIALFTRHQWSVSFTHALPALGWAGQSAEVRLQTGRSVLSVCSAAQKELTLLEQNPSVKNTEKKSHPTMSFYLMHLLKKSSRFSVLKQKLWQWGVLGIRVVETGKENCSVSQLLPIYCVRHEMLFKMRTINKKPNHYCKLGMSKNWVLPAGKILNLLQTAVVQESFRASVSNLPVELLCLCCKVVTTAGSCQDYGYGILEHPSSDSCLYARSWRHWYILSPCGCVQVY